jgi:hypothetical protein
MSAGYYYVGSYYVDITTPSAPVLYRCITSGNKTTSVWAQVSASGSPTVEPYNNSHGYNVGSVVIVLTTVTVGGITIIPGAYICANTVAASGSANQIPQFPLPLTGTIYWYLLAPGISTSSLCTAAGTQQIYVASSGPF